MYTLSSKLKLTAIILIVVGAIGLVYGFISTPSNQEELKELMASDAHGEHSSDHVEATANIEGHGAEENHHASSAEVHENETAHETEAHGEAEHGDEHMEHVLHQFQTKPWSAVFVSGFFFLMIALGALVFYAIQYVAQAGWSPVLFRVIEGITNYILPGSIIVVLIVLFAGEHFYPWQNHELVEEDVILQGKSGYLNFPFFVIRAIIYLIGWNLYRFIATRNSVAQATANTLTPYKKNFKASVFFLLFFVITETTMAWDWFMSMTPHWYSTLFAWYIFASMFVSAITVIAMVTMFLKKLGHLSFVNDSHLHDLAKFMFAFSVFWTYLWFGQFLLIWYANIPEEVTYFIIRIEEYNLLFFGMIVLNFIFPILMLINTDYKRIPWFVMMAGVLILVGHYIDIFLLVMPSTVGPYWSFGIPEIGSILFFLGLFILFVGTGLGKESLYPKGNPFLKESENYHY
ncbi:MULTISPECIES: quinol:cytochrome C oxidoreductase [unclassified Zunongwangia]|uniref:quinol:cytochrome C oxidoreductase n=1 Tax=unclassified Zunongwangia TaxID=2632541 RepID=UPI0022DE0DD6|nr:MULTISPECIES: quinol:cytochrome C oxidoreductase [unclassified Zunongwangia]WBL22021.1 quinol:cytochrome C oxidoreductase [Zunongwangia sp. HRR-M8]WBL26028.1 quinol:cytochrome C oxidoreductase [Zunongwangia sp. HGR-M22]